MTALRFTSFAAFPALMCTGCNGVFWGNLGVLCVTVAIFLGTVFLSRNNEASRTATRSSASSTTRT